MKNREITRQVQRIKALLKKVDEASAGNVELQSHWARYACVLMAGLIENAYAEVYSAFVKGNAQAPVASYATHMLSSVQNPKTKRFLETSERFKPSWRSELEAFVDQDGRKDAIDSIMANRHLIAHGSDSGITMARVRTYLDKALEVMEFIENQLSR
ncbi:HEPN domain-containing protein [Pseudogemmatithrix spongiicola]|uniref:HEPN domain-containing protein n=1 Tax=Pseudogemmatithrix spongiicola TaxID=3062599 RepID=A0AA49Q4K3_9BACT|nr:HEPN domain-containing protein [Gemmatimonadaceae bacterium 'strain 138']WKW14846.1 HEPN domain-containing protein [Gemmatimonadaceae bacterium 'strain 318']